MSTKTRLGSTLAACLMLSGCFTLSNQPALDAVGARENAAAGGAGASKQPFVEAWVEYPGPPPQWAGPASMAFHLDARDTGAVKVAFGPSAVPAVAPPAHWTTPSEHRVAAKVTGEAARTHLAEFAEAIEAESIPFTGCLNPVRAKLVRQDGTVSEKRGCRTQQGWAGYASRFVNQYLVAAGFSAAPPVADTSARQPAAKK